MVGSLAGIGALEVFYHPFDGLIRAPALMGTNDLGQRAVSAQQVQAFEVRAFHGFPEGTRIPAFQRSTFNRSAGIDAAFFVCILIKKTGPRPVPPFDFDYFLIKRDEAVVQIPDHLTAP